MSFKKFEARILTNSPAETRYKRALAGSTALAGKFAVGLAALSCAFTANSALALDPTKGAPQAGNFDHVVGGVFDADATKVGNITTITQTSDKGIINWNKPTGASGGPRW